MIMLGGMNVFLGPLVGAVHPAAAERHRDPVHRTLQPGARHRHPGLRARPAQGRCSDFVRATAWASVRAPGGARPADCARPRASADMLKIENLSKSFGGVAAINDVTLHFADGLAHRRDRSERRRQDHVLQPHHRRVAAGRAAGSCSTARTSPGCSPPEIVRRGIGRAFQIASIFPSLTVRGDHARRGQRASRLAARCAGVSRWPKRRDRADEVMELVGLDRQAATASRQPLARRSEAARYRAGAGARAARAAARRADRRHGDRKSAGR